MAHATRGSSELPKILRQLLGKLFPEVEEEQRGREATLSHVLENWNQATQSAMAAVRDQVRRNLPREA